MRKHFEQFARLSAGTPARKRPETETLEKCKRKCCSGMFALLESLMVSGGSRLTFETLIDELFAKGAASYVTSVVEVLNKDMCVVLIDAVRTYWKSGKLPDFVDRSAYSSAMAPESSPVRREVKKALTVVPGGSRQAVGCGPTTASLPVAHSELQKSGVALVRTFESERERLTTELAGEQRRMCVYERACACACARARTYSVA